QAEGRLRISEERFALAVRGSNDGIWDWDLQTDAIFFSPRFKELLGFRDDEFPNRLDACWERMHPEDVPATREAIEANRVRVEPVNVQFRLKMKAGEWRYFRSRGDCVRGPDGTARRLAGSLTDVTSAVLAEHELTRTARLDKLTGLPNRTLFLDRLQ